MRKQNPWYRTMYAHEKVPPSGTVRLQARGPNNGPKVYDEKLHYSMASSSTCVFLIRILMLS
jgi:hypothetical protein